MKKDAKDILFVRLNPPADVPKDTPNVVLSHIAFKKMRLWTQLGAEIGKVEVSGMGIVFPKFQSLYVSDIFLIKPEKIGAAQVDMDGKSVQELMMEVMTRGPKFKGFKEQLRIYQETGTFTDPDAFVLFADLLDRSNKLRNLRFHWHSHNNFGVGWSGVDNKTATEEFCPDAKWTVSIVTNARGDFLARQDFPKSRGATRHNLPVWLYLGIPSHMSKRYRKDYDDKVGAFMRGPAQQEFLQEVVDNDDDFAETLPEEGIPDAV